MAPATLLRLVKEGVDYKGSGSGRKYFSTQEEANLVEKVKHVVRSGFEVTRKELGGIIYKELNVLIEKDPGREMPKDLDNWPHTAYIHRFERRNGLQAFIKKRIMGLEEFKSEDVEWETII